MYVVVSLCFHLLWIAPAFLLRGAMLKQGVIQRGQGDIEEQEVIYKEVSRLG